MCCSSPLQLIGKLLTRKMEDTWKDSEIAGKFTAVIPFLPYTPSDIRAVVDQGVQNLIDKLVVTSRQWASVRVTDAAVGKLALVSFVEYTEAKRKSGEVSVRVGALSVTFGGFEFASSHNPRCSCQWKCHEW